MNADWMLREQGSRDWRMLPVAAVIWAASLGAHIVFGLWTDGTSAADAAGVADGTVVSDAAGVEAHVAWDPGLILPAGVLVCAVLLLVVLIAHYARACWAGMSAVCVAAAIIGGMTAISADMAIWLDPATVQARASSSYGEVRAKVMSPVVASDQRAYDCQVDVRLHGVSNGTQAERQSAAKARVYASGTYCTQLGRGAEYRMHGTLQKARYGRMPLWLLIQGQSPALRIRAAPMPVAMVEHMQEAFFSVTDQLSDQGRVLVPGLTMGVLGQDHIGSDGGVTTIDGTYARTLEDRFRRSGIMHLMAVSGGHFVLVAGMVRRLCMRLLIDRRLVALMVAGVYALLAMAMFPSDSVTRALIMGFIGALAYALGRRSQALSALSWTVIGVLIVEPGMSESFGFALSSAAVLGIVLFSRPLGKTLGRLLPGIIANLMAMTIAAQLFTLPIQVLMDPQLPLLSIPANLMVAPCVGFATIAGLMALCCAWCAPWLAGVFAEVSSLGTLVMEQVALWLGGSDLAVVPWSGGPLGAVTILLVEFGVGVCAMAIIRGSHRIRREDAGLSGEFFGSAWRVRVALWWHDTLRILLPANHDG
jgi:ComEC/Rec2-related protein